MSLRRRLAFLLALPILHGGCTAGDAAPPGQGLTGNPDLQGGGAQGGQGGGQGGQGTAGLSGNGGSGGSGGSGQAGKNAGGGPGGGGPGGGGPGGGGPGGGGPGGGGPGGGGPGGSGTAGQGQAGQGNAGSGGAVPGGKCATTFTITLPSGASNPRVAGEWNNFDLATATKLDQPGPGGAMQGTVALPPGLHGYKVIYDQGGQPSWVLDPNQGRRKYVGGVENSGVKVRDCSLPSFTAGPSTITRPSPGQGSYAATLTYVAGAGGAAAPAGYTLTLEGVDGQKAPLSADSYAVDAQGNLTLKLAGLADGKYRLVVTPKDQGGTAGEPLRLIFWVEEKPFSWQDALIYMVMTDRYKDGDPTNNAAPIAGVDSRGDYQGGDLEGLRQSIAAGTLDKLGVRAIWLTPFQTNPAGSYPASDGVHQVTGYHGYWPTRGREVDARLGGAAALHAVVTEAHKHGIRILQDYVVNHVHQEHEYFKEHPEWFRTGCVCGTNNCDWTSHALDCLFTSYLPDVNHTVPEANAQLVSDAVFWLDEFGIDGIRVDAVKHVEEVATRNLVAEVREVFEPSGTKHFLMGETAMGWGDCPDPCNDENYGTISKYIGPHGLDGQFDFVLYHGVSYNTFAYQSKGMLHADYWTLQKWPAGSIMTPYIGSHDTARFLSLADYGRPGKDAGVPNNQWDNIAQAPTDAVPYQRARVALAWLLALPGAPLLYYGDEYGQFGGVDPNNRMMWRDESKLSQNEKDTLAFVRLAGTARQAVAPLRRGAYVGLTGSTEDVLVFGRQTAPGDAAVVGVNRSGQQVAIKVAVQAALGLAPGTMLNDALGGPGSKVLDSGDVVVNVPASGAVVLAP
jgi:glycosidase